MTRKEAIEAAANRYYDALKRIRTQYDYDVVLAKELPDEVFTAEAAV